MTKAKARSAAISPKVPTIQMRIGTVSPIGCGTKAGLSEIRLSYMLQTSMSPRTPTGIHTRGITSRPSAAVSTTSVKHRIVYTRNERILCCIQSAVSARTAI